MMSFNKFFVLCACLAAIILCTSTTETTPDSQNRKQPKLHVFEGVVQYNVHKKDIEQDSSKHCTESPEFELHHVTWKIEACKGSVKDNFKSYLVVKLVSVFRERTAEWSCEAEANFKLLPKESSYNAKHVRFAYFNYTRVQSSPNKKEIVGWDDLLNRYVINDVATLEVTIKVKPPNRIPDIQHTSTKFQMRLLDVKTLNELYSDETSVRGMRWKALAMKQNEYLSVFILVNEDDIDLNYAWKVTATIQLISMDSDKTVTRTFSSIQFDWTRTNYGFNTFLKWTELMDPNNKFVIGNTALLQIELNVAKPNPIT